MQEYDLSYILNELGEERASYAGSVTPPLYQASNFCAPTLQQMRETMANEMNTPFYTRGYNPTVAILRKKVAALECMEDALIFSSGIAAVSAAVLHKLKSGDHIVCVNKPYSWTGKLLTSFLERFNVSVSMIDGTDPENWRQAIRPNTSTFMLESPNSITFELQDLEAVTGIAREHGIKTVLDNSYASPLNQKAGKSGIDIVVHSASKYLNGHSDVVAGVLCTSRKITEELFESEYMTLGGIISPHDAWLMIRSLRTLEIRMDRVAASTMKIVSWLENHPQVKKMHYPFSPTHPQYDLARKQMKNGTGQFTIELKATRLESIDAFCNKLSRFLMACSWGGHESLIFPISALYTSQNYANTALPWDMIRFYIGLEDPDILIRDLEAGFKAMEEAENALIGEA